MERGLDWGWLCDAVKSIGLDFDPSVGGEIQKIRPAVIMSNNSANVALNRVVVVPLSTQIGRLYPSETMVQVRGRTSKSMADQLQTVSKLRFGSFIGMLSADEMAGIEKTLLLQLGMSHRGT